MSYAAKSTAGTTVAVTISGSPVTINGIASVSGPGGDKEEIDITALSDTAKQKIAGQMDWGSIDMEMFYDSTDTGQAYVFTQATTANTTDTLTITSSDNGAASIACSGSFKGWRWEFGKNAGVLARVSFVLSGAPSVT